MTLYHLLFLLVSILLTILAAWNVNLLKRLKNASKTYNTSDDMEDSCHVTKEYVEWGYSVGLIVLFVSLLVFSACSYSLYLNTA